MRKTLLLLLMIFTITSFKTNDKQHYKYRYVIEAFKDGETAVLISNNCINYEDYIIEFIDKDYITNEFSNNELISSTTITKQDRVNFIHFSSQSYFSIDTFSKNSKKIEQGPLHQKKSGTHFPAQATTTPQTVYKLSDCKDTIINNIAHLYYPFSIKDQTGADSIFCKVLFMKKIGINLISQTELYKILDHQFPFAGGIFFTKDGSEGSAVYIKDLMPLSPEEEQQVKEILTVHTKKS